MTVVLNQGIRLLSGCLFDYNAPDKSEVQIEDIAAALSKVCRFSGHIHRFYSVAQHAINASRIVPHEFAFDALMHDTAEAFTNDIPTPLKFAVPAFKELEVRIETAMAKRFGFSYPMPECVKVADAQMLSIEKIALKQDFSERETLKDVETSTVEHLVDLSPISPRAIEQQFMKRYHELRA